MEILTKDNEITDIGMVRVRMGKRAEDAVISLSYVTTQLQVAAAEVQKWQGKVAELQLLKTQIEAVAQGIKLKVVEVKPDVV